MLQEEYSVGAGLVPAVDKGDCPDKGQPQGIAPTNVLIGAEQVLITA